MLRQQLQEQIQAGNSNQFIRAFREMFNKSMNVLDTDVQKLYDAEKDMAAIRLFQEQAGIIINVEESLNSIYSMIFGSQQQIQHYNSRNKNLTMLPLSSFWKEDADFDMSKFYGLRMKEFEKNMSLYIDKETDEIDFELLSSNINDRLYEENGYGERSHWYIKTSLLNEIDYMLDFLEVFLEEDYMPVEEDSDEEKPNRHIPKEVKVSVWRRDKGQCVQCGSKEKLEYDHIIPVSKGGSNTERNIQLLCEKCNRQKSATIM